MKRENKNIIKLTGFILGTGGVAAGCRTMSELWPESVESEGKVLANFWRKNQKVFEKIRKCERILKNGYNCVFLCKCVKL